MGRHLDSVCKLCRRERVKLYLKGARCDSPKCAIDRRDSPPGMHGHRRGKTSEYGVRLREKQKLKRFYGLFERQFRRFFTIASRSPNTGEGLLTLMERRLDNVVYRLGFLKSRAAARQFITHGHILVNGKFANIPSYIVKEGDVITVKDRPKSRALVKLNLQDSPPPVPDFLDRVSTDPPEGRISRLPNRLDVDPHIKDIQEQLIIEVSAR